MGENRVKRTKINTDWEIKNSAPEMSYKLEMKKFSLFFRRKFLTDLRLDVGVGDTKDCAGRELSVKWVYLEVLILRGK